VRTKNKTYKERQHRRCRPDDTLSTTMHALLYASTDQWSVPCFRGRQVGECAQSSFARSGRDMALCWLCSRLCLFVRDPTCLLAIAEMPRGVWQNWRCHQQRHVPVNTGAAVSLEVCLTLVVLTVHWVNAAAVLDYKLQVPNVSCSCTARYLVPSCTP
jgi:hypothetical protein